PRPYHPRAREVVAAVPGLLVADDAPHAGDGCRRGVAIVSLSGPGGVVARHDDELITVQSVADHLAVAGLEDVEGHDGVREEHHRREGKHLERGLGLLDALDDVHSPLLTRADGHLPDRTRRLSPL